MKPTNPLNYTRNQHLNFLRSIQSLRLLKDGRLLLRQAIAAWMILLLGTIFFATIALIISLSVQNQDLILIITLAIVTPLCFWGHVVLLRRGYYTTQSRKSLDNDKQEATE